LLGTGSAAAAIGFKFAAAVAAFAAGVAKFAAAVAAFAAAVASFAAAVAGSGFPIWAWLSRFRAWKRFNACCNT